ncbi:MAG: GNAT family N-acetyltransferase [Chitinophagaceae bacterium]
MFPQLETERFLLKQVQPEDQRFLFEALSDPVAMPYNGVYFSSFEETKQQLEWYEKNLKDGTGIHWKITEKQTNENIGVISVYYFKPQHKKAELGYWLLPRFWQKGIALEVLKPVIKYWQQERDLHRLEAFVEEENTASIRLMEKAGFQWEGTMRECEIKFGRFISLRIYSLLSTDGLAV